MCQVSTEKILLSMVSRPMSMTILSAKSTWFMATQFLKEKELGNEDAYDRVFDCEHREAA